MIVVTTQSAFLGWSTSFPHDTILVMPEAKAQGLASVLPDTLLVNHGIVVAGGTDAIFTTNGVDVVNKAGASVSGANEVHVLGSGCTLVNDGLIVDGAGQGVFLQAAADNYSLVNTGDIFGAQSAVRIDALNAINVSINNSGEIHGDVYGIWLQSALGAAPVIVNTGTIDGGLDSILAELGDRLNVTNSGLLSGASSISASRPPTPTTTSSTIVRMATCSTTATATCRAARC